MRIHRPGMTSEPTGPSEPSDHVSRRFLGQRFPRYAAIIAAIAVCSLVASCRVDQSTYPFGPYVEHAVIRGVVRDPFGNPVSGAIVTVTITDAATGSPDVTDGRVETGATGVYRITLERMGPSATVPVPPEAHQATVVVARAGSSGLSSAPVVVRFAAKRLPAPEVVADVVFTP